MRIYTVDEHQVVHTCPGNPEPHPVDTLRTVVHLTEPQPCRAPVTVSYGTTTVTIDCGRHEPHDRQCDACRIVITTRTVTITDLGYQGPAHLAPGLFEVTR